MTFADPGNALVEVRNVEKTFGDGESAVRALRGVDFRVHPGEIVLLMGPSGSGKTTLLQTLGCLLTPSAGQVLVHGQDVTGLDEGHRSRLRLRHFGFVFQSYNLFPMLTATENVLVAFDLIGRKDPAIHAEARDLLERVGLGHRRQAYPAQMSGGEKQRVAIARALAGKPEILLADEPTAALDSTTGHRAMELFHSIAKKDRHAVLIVTHDPRILDFADRIVHLADGAVTDGPVAHS